MSQHANLASPPTAPRIDPKALAGPRTHAAVLGILQAFPMRGRLVDLGCGQGSLCRRLHEMGFEVVAADNNPGLFKAEEVPFERVDVSKPFPFEDGSFDFVTSVEVIEHLEDQYTFIRECCRVLAPGGTLVLTTPNVMNIGSRWMYFWTGRYPLFTRPVNEFVRAPEHDHISPTPYLRLRHMLHSSGLRLERVTTDRHRRSDVLGLLLWPLFALATLRMFRRERDQRQRRANREIMRHLMTVDVLLGRTLVIVASKHPAPSPDASC